MDRKLGGPGANKNNPNKKKQKIGRKKQSSEEEEEDELIMEEAPKDAKNKQQNVAHFWVGHTRVVYSPYILHTIFGIWDVYARKVV